MFGVKKEGGSSGAKSDPSFDPRAIPIHTMRDDLDMLEGKSAPQAPSVPENSPFKSDPPAQKARPDLAVPASVPSAPFSGGSLSSKAAGFPSGASAVSSFGSEARAKTATPLQEEVLPAENHNWTRIVGIFILCIAGLSLLGGGYYVYMTRYNMPDVEIQVPTPPTDQPGNVPESEPAAVLEKFSADKPNYLMLDVERMGVLDIQKMILQKSIEIKEDQKTVPVEFVAVDVNNNPIAFKIFAVLMKIELSQKMLDNLKDEFSLFIFPDQGNVRVGLALEPKNPGKVASDMKAEERTLAKNLDPLFLGEKAKSLAGSFRDSKEGGLAIRYVNLNDQNSLSVDYWIQEGRLFVATSKNTGRAIIEKMAALKK